MEHSLYSAEREHSGMRKVTWWQAMSNDFQQWFFVSLGSVPPLFAMQFWSVSLQWATMFKWDNRDIQQISECKAIQDASPITFSSIPLTKENCMAKSTLKEMDTKVACVQLLLRASIFVYSDPEKKEMKPIVVPYSTRSCFPFQSTSSLLNNSNWIKHHRWRMPIISACISLCLEQITASYLPSSVFPG